MRRGGSRTYRGSSFLFGLFSSFRGIGTGGLSAFFISLELSALIPSMASPLGRRVMLLAVVAFCFTSVLRRLRIGFGGRGLINLSLAF